MERTTQANRPTLSKTGEHRPLRDGSPEGRARLQTAGGVTMLGAVANAILSALKAAVGLAGGSSVLVADAVHSLSDLATDILVLLGLRVASKPPDEGHPYGHGRYETLATAVLAGLLLAVAAGIAWDAWSRSGAPAEPALITLWVAVLSIAVKEMLFQVTVRAGRRCHSSLVIANAWHHRSDALSSVAAFGGILGARIGFPILDPAAAVVVAALIAKMALELLADSIREVTDATLKRDITHELGTEIRRLPGVVNLHELRARRMGPRLLVDLHVEVDGSTTVSDGHQVAERVRQLVFQKQAGGSEVLVHVDPEPDEDLQPGDHLARPREEIETEVRQIALGVDGVRAVTHVLPHFLECRVALQIQIEVDPGLRVHEAAAVARSLRSRVEEVNGVDHADIHLELDGLAHRDLPPTLQGPRSRTGELGESVVPVDNGWRCPQGPRKAVAERKARTGHFYLGEDQTSVLCADKEEKGLGLPSRLRVSGHGTNSQVLPSIRRASDPGGLRAQERVRLRVGHGLLDRGGVGCLAETIRGWLNRRQGEERRCNAGNSYSCFRSPRFQSPSLAVTATDRPLRQRSLKFRIDFSVTTTKD